MTSETVRRNTSTRLSASFTSPSRSGATTASISSKLQYDIEEDYDYLYAEVSTDGGKTWADVKNNLVKPKASGITGSSSGAWVDSTYDLSAYAGKTVLFRYRYATDGGVHYAGAFLDNVSLTKNGTVAWSDDAETLAAIEAAIEATGAGSDEPPSPPPHMRAAAGSPR